MTENKTPLPVTLEFNCPVCGSAEGLGHVLARQVKDRGLMRREIDYAVLMLEGIVRDPSREPMVPVGSTLPAFKIFVEVCMKCGCLFAAKIIIGEVKKGMNTVIKPPPPGQQFSTS